MKKIVIALVASLAIAFLALHSINADDMPSVVYVDDDFDESVEGWNETCFSSIQAAINATKENGTVYVYDGIYYENIILNKKLNLIGKNKPIIKSIVMEANGSVVKNFEFEGNGNAILLNASFCIISSCFIHNYEYGIVISKDNNTITRCNFINNSYGIYVSGSGNKIFLNNFIDNTINACNYGSNEWHNESMQKGNYWYDYGGSDGNDDGIGDTPYVIPCGSGSDGYPLMNQIDLFIPLINIALNGSVGNNGWYVSNVTVTINASDNSGIDYVNYSLDGAWYSSNNAMFSFTLSEGNHEVKCYAVDVNKNAGRIEEAMVKIDTTKPSISYDISPAEPNGKNGWYVSNVEISLYASDSTSGIDELSYKIDSGGWQDYDGFFSINIEGEHKIYFKAIDKAGNVAEANVTVKIDKNAPSVAITKPNSGFVRQQYEIKWNATDNVDENLDGNISIYYSPDNGTTWQEIATAINNTGSYIWNTYGFADSKEAFIKITAEDDAGNVGVAISNKFALDNSPPHITIKQPVEGKAYGKDEYGNVLIEIEWEAYDNIDENLDGSIGIYYYHEAWHEIVTNYSNTGRYTLNAKEWEDGSYKIKIIAEDDAGNVGVAISGNFTIDKQPPSIYMSRPLKGYVYINLFGREVIPPLPLPLPSYDAVIIGKITVEVTAADAHSGIQRVEIEADGEMYPLYSPPYKWEWNPSLGTHTLKATAYDNAGNSRSYPADGGLKVLCLNL